MFSSDFTQYSKLSPSSTTLPYDGITASYHSYLSSFSKDINRSLDVNRVQRFIDTQTFIQSHNNNRHHRDISNNSFNRDKGESAVNLIEVNSNRGVKKDGIDTAQQSSSKIATPTYFLRENQFSDLTHQEISRMFIQDPLSFDSIPSPISASMTSRISSSINSDSNGNRQSADNYVIDDNTKLDTIHNKQIHYDNDVNDHHIPISSNVYLDYNLRRRRRDSRITEPSNNARIYDTIATTSSSSISSSRSKSASMTRQITATATHNSANSNGNNSSNDSYNSNDNSINSFFKPTYATSFNWATNNNPKQRSILPSGVRNQGMCGACWAFVATSSVEASISKNVDYFVTKDISSSTSSSSASSSSTHTHKHNHSQHTAVQFSDSVTSISTTMTATSSDIMITATNNIDNNSSDVNNGRHDKHDENGTKIIHTNTNTPYGLSDNGAIALSVQELIDCDTEYDRGCAGGNPVNAFRYIMANGLTTADSYPLSAQQKTGGGSSSSGGSNTATASSNTCRSTETDPVRGSIKGFISITPFRQDLMLQSLVTQGPLSVGICGTDMTFLYYGGGIYNPETCCSTLNHALLIIGYGTDSTSGLDYWLVQNSWGSLWGEGGYMRILRSSSSDIAHPGVCGLALTPSVALGGYFMKGGNFSKGNNNNGGGSGSNTDYDKNHHGGGSYYGKFKDMINNVHTWMTSNWKMALFAAVSACFLLSSTAFLYLCILDFASHHFYRRRGRSGSSTAANSSRNRSQRIPNISNKASIVAVGTGVSVLANDSHNTTNASNNNNKTTALAAPISSSTGLINNTNTSTNNYNYSNSTTDAIIPKPSPHTTYPLSIMKGSNSNNNNMNTATTVNNNNNSNNTMGNMPSAATIAAFNKPSYTNKTFYNNNTSTSNNNNHSTTTTTTIKSMPVNINRNPSFTATADAATGNESETVALISISGKHKRDKTYTSTTT